MLQRIICLTLKEKQSQTIEPIAQEPPEFWLFYITHFLAQISVNHFSFFHQAKLWRAPVAQRHYYHSQKLIFLFKEPQNLLLRSILVKPIFKNSLFRDFHPFGQMGLSYFLVWMIIQPMIHLGTLWKPAQELGFKAGNAFNWCSLSVSLPPFYSSECFGLIRVLGWCVSECFG